MAKIKYLSLDLETYSSVDIRSSGAYAYAESPDFQILLLGYRFDDMEEAKVIDLSNFFDKEEAVDYLASHHPEVFAALTDPETIKTAFNANFERICLGRYFGYMDPAQWRCTMVRCGAAGLPMSLEGAGAALHLPEDKAKLKIGKALINYFCKPCKPTKTNGGRRRNLPEHDTEKWRLFKEYCARDVDTEHTILEIVGLDVLPESEQRLWELDQKMNDYGVRLDVPYIEGILEYSENRNEELKAEAKELTGLENPNSVAQLREWLSDHGVETASLTKADVERILSGECDADVRRVLEIRQALGKTSTKKYAAMMEAVCGDDRLRGILQYYGANRSGRWAGRIVQVHNLPQNHIDDLDWVRRKIAEQDFEAVEMVYGELAFLFSQLIRTAFIPSEGNTFIVSDFSAIEARVLAWLAGEKWRMDVFKNGGDIYCQSASAMFGVPVEKHGINGHLRQKGKVAELACIAEGSPVLTDKGLVPIQDVTTDMKLWDGEDWVSHDVVIYKGEKEVITYEGLTATEDHLVWVEGKPEPVHFGVAASSGAHLVQTGDGRRKIRLGEDNKPGEEMEQELEPVLYVNGVPRLWCRPMDAPEQPYKGEVEGLPAVLSAETDSEVVRQKANGSKAEMHESERQRLPELRSEGDQVLLSQREGGRALSDRDLRSSGQIDGIGPDRLERGLCARESEIRGAGDQSGQPAEHDTVPIRAKVLAIRGERCGAEAVIRDDTRADHRGCEEGSTGKTESMEGDRKKVRVYDIRNAGRHHRFTISGKLVHNCGYQGGVGAMKQMDSSGAIPEEELPGIVARWREASPNIVRLWYSMERAAKIAILDSRPKSRPVYLKKFDPKRARENERIMGADPGEYSDWFIDREACVAFYMDGEALKMMLPSGRCLSYWNARVVRKEDGRDHIVYEGVNQTTKQWTEIETYGGKLVENCLAGDTKVLTNNGIKCITDVLDTDLLWDGIEWVTHEGLIPKGKQTTINIDGIRMTAEHRILTKGGWRSASQIKRHHRYKMRIPDSGFLRWIRWPKVPVEYPLRVRKKHSHARVRISKNEAEILRMQAGPTHRRKAYKTWIVRSPHLERMAFNDAEMYKPESPGMEKLWRTRHCSMPRMAHVRKFLQRHGSRVQARLVAGQDRRGRSLLQRELQMGYPERAGQKQKEHSLYRHTHRKNASYRSFRTIRYQKHNAAIPGRARMAGGYAVHKAGLSEQVFDIQNAGPRHRFAVMSDSRIIIVHNCVQGIARDCLAETLKRVSAAGYHIVMHVHDEIIVDTPKDTAEESFEEITELMGISPVWAPGLILKGDGYMTDYYRKD